MKLLSIVIPTRGREFYCIEAIKNILSYKRDDFELVICDNSDTDKIEDYLKKHKDERVVYKHIKGRINSVINMDTAMRMATGDYVCMIGDDDTILPSIFDTAAWAKENNFDNVTPRKMFDYFWPDTDGNNGYLRWLEFDNSDYSINDSQEKLKMFIEEGLIGYFNYLPRVYHGLVKNVILHKILKTTGHIIGGLSPDIYLAVAISCLTKNYISVERAFTVAGACPESFSGLNSKGKISLSLGSNPQFYKRGDYIWDYRIPQITLAQTIWAETAIKAIEEMNRSDLISNFNQGYFFANLLCDRKFIIEKVKQISKTALIGSKCSVIYNFLKYIAIMLLYKGKKKQNATKIVENVPSMDDAIRIIQHID